MRLRTNVGSAGEVPPGEFRTHQPGGSPPLAWRHVGPRTADSTVNEAGNSGPLLNPRLFSRKIPQATGGEVNGLRKSGGPRRKKPRPRAPAGSSVPLVADIGTVTARLGQSSDSRGDLRLRTRTFGAPLTCPVRRLFTHEFETEANYSRTSRYLTNRGTRNSAITSSRFSTRGSNMGISRALFPCSCLRKPNR